MCFNLIKIKIVSTEKDQKPFSDWASCLIGTKFPGPNLSRLSGIDYIQI